MFSGTVVASSGMDVKVGAIEGEVVEKVGETGLIRLVEWERDIEPWPPEEPDSLERPEYTERRSPWSLRGVMNIP